MDTFNETTLTTQPTSSTSTSSTSLNVTEDDKSGEDLMDKHKTIPEQRGIKRSGKGKGKPPKKNKV
jgi:hypothetical protein